MDELIQCECGHGIANHTALGCESMRTGRCQCQLNAQDVLHHAVSGARLEWSHHEQAKPDK